MRIMLYLQLVGLHAICLLAAVVAKNAARSYLRKTLGMRERTMHAQTQ
jgi:hypothetical protein